jgi:hypothetical protein
MNPLSRLSLALILLLSFCISAQLSAATTHVLQQDHASATAVPVWMSNKAEHAYGFPDVKPNKKGVLTLSADALTFSGKSGTTSIPRTSVTAVSAGNQRIELWGLGGRILRMTIPDGGGLAAAAVMHHRVDMLTVEFRDGQGGDHGAVFFLPANEAERALQSFALAPSPIRRASDAACQNPQVEPGSVLVSTPNWDHVEVPAAYRALVYEHVIDRLRHTKDIGHVYRDGEENDHDGCPQHTIRISIATFKEGSSVKRAFLGPAGMFVGTTQMKFDVTFTDASAKQESSEQITATMRGESESSNVADHIAKNLAKHYATALKKAPGNNAAKTNSGKTNGPTV